MPVAWRIVKERHAHDAFSGQGARIAGGRWNSKGVAVVYASESKALAALEILVHFNPRPSVFPSYKAFRLEFEEDLIEPLEEAALPEDWQSEPPGPKTMRIGDAWALRGRTPILAVPSVIITDEFNYLLNPGHPDFFKIHISHPRDFKFDRRLLPPTQ